MKKILVMVAILIALIAVPTVAFAHSQQVAGPTEGTTTGHAASPAPQCSLVPQSGGSAQQENLLFCISGVEPDNGLVYKAAMNVASASPHVIVGTPLYDTSSVDWGGNAITYVEFSSGYHAEYHADHLVRFYNNLNQLVYCC